MRARHLEFRKQYLVLTHIKTLSKSADRSSMLVWLTMTFNPSDVPRTCPQLGASMRLGVQTSEYAAAISLPPEVSQEHASGVSRMRKHARCHGDRRSMRSADLKQLQDCWERRGRSETPSATTTTTVHIHFTGRESYWGVLLATTAREVRPPYIHVTDFILHGEGLNRYR